MLHAGNCQLVAHLLILSGSPIVIPLFVHRADHSGPCGAANDGALRSAAVKGHAEHRGSRVRTPAHGPRSIVMAELRPEIPDPMKRAVRQRCGFGCVICGTPLYAYDHIIDYREVKEHKAENLTLLCDSHHREKTNGLLPLAQVQKRNASPYNIQHGVSSPYGLHLDGPRFDVLFGGNQFFEERSTQGTPF